MNSYVLVLLPPKDVAKTVNKYRKKYAKYTKYIIPPHITIFPPFFLKDISEKELVARLRESFLNEKSKRISLNSIGYFEGINNVLYFKPDTISSKYIVRLLITAVKSLGSLMKSAYEDYNFTPEKFVPHMTIAERVPDTIFSVVKEELSNYKNVISFTVSSIYVYKDVDGSGNWNQLQEIVLNK